MPGPIIEPQGEVEIDQPELTQPELRDIMMQMLLELRGLKMAFIQANGQNPDDFRATNFTSAHTDDWNSSSGIV
jgi:hypothetical protein